MKKNLYETLGVKPEATPAELKRARRKKAAKAHPDHGGDQVEMSQINHAYDVLIDPSRRLLYDSTGEDSAASKESRVQGLIMGAFADALIKDAPGILIHAMRFVDDAKQSATKQRADGKRALKSLKDRRDKIKTAGPVNAFHLVIDQNITHVEQKLAGLDNDIAMIDEALEELKSYSSDEKLVVEFKDIQSIYGSTTTTGGTWG